MPIAELSSFRCQREGLSFCLTWRAAARVRNRINGEEEEELDKQAGRKHRSVYSPKTRGEAAEQQGVEEDAAGRAGLREKGGDVDDVDGEEWGGRRHDTYKDAASYLG